MGASQTLTALTVFALHYETPLKSERSFVIQVVTTRTENKKIVHNNGMIGSLEGTPTTDPLYAPANAIN
jgi:hypothetical protein